MLSNRKGPLALFGIVCFSSLNVASAQSLPNPILFVTQTPQPYDFTTIASVFGNHRGDVESVPRGGGLWIRYTNGTLKNLTLAVGLGQTSTQLVSSIAVREPSVHWSGTKAVFSMVKGSPNLYQVKEYFWQLYEVSNFLDPLVTPVITKVPNQPTNFNNVAACYGTDGRIIFASDRPRDGQLHLYPQLDEYEEAPTVSGLWSLDPATGDLFMMNHAPSGVFSPSVDSYGRVVFSRWDHLQRDQQADGDGTNGTEYGTFNYSSEFTNALILTNNRAEIFPEPRYTVGATNSHTFNQFFPWQINEDGTGEETLNHIGRHELGGSYGSVAFNNDPNLSELYDFDGHYNTNTINNFVQPRESPVMPGWYYGIDAPEFRTHAAGQIVVLKSPITNNADFIRIQYLTHRDTSSYTATPTTNHSGLYRNPLPLSDGQLIAVHTPETRLDQNIGTFTLPKSRYDFRLKIIIQTNGVWKAGAPLTPGISNSVSWWSPDVLITYTGLMWELDPVEVYARPVPDRLAAELPPLEASVFADEGVTVSALQSWLRSRGLALIVGRDTTERDRSDNMQPFNLKIPGGIVTTGAVGKIYSISHMQLFQGDLVRGIGMVNGQGTPRKGRRVLAQQMHDAASENLPNPTGPPASVRLAADGSFASFVPGRRAMSWQTTDSNGTAVVRERYWLTFQHGEVRVCTSCHGVNRFDQSGQPPATNAPLALRELLRYWKQKNGYSEIRGVNQGNNPLQINVSGAPSHTNIVEYTTDLQQWIALATNSTSTNGMFVIDDPGAAQSTNRFYRVRVQ